MQSRSFWASLVILLLLLSAGIYSMRGRSGVPETPTPTPVPWVVVAEKVSPEERAATELRQGPCQPGETVPAEEAVRTGPEGWASLCLPDSSRIYLAANTILRIDLAAEGEEKSKTFLHLQRGKIWVNRISGAINVDTPIGTGSTTGSWVSVSYLPGEMKMTVACGEGKCRLASEAGKVSLKGFEQAWLIGAGAPGEAQPMNTAEIVDWVAHVPGLGPTAVPGSATPTRQNPSPTAIVSTTPTPTSTPSPMATTAASATAASTLAPTQAAGQPTAKPNTAAPVPSATQAPSQAPTQAAPDASPSPTSGLPTPFAVILPTGTMEDLDAPSPTPTSTTAPVAAAGLAAGYVTAPAVSAYSNGEQAALALPQGAGPVPGPSPTWSVQEFFTPVPAAGPTKLGFHVTLNSGGVLDYVAAVHPPVMKGVDDIGFLRDVKAVSPETLTIGRYVTAQLNIGEGDPAERAVEFVNEWLPKYLEAADYVDYWEGWNEVTYPNYEWFAQFEAARACEMQKHGLRAAIGAFSAGTPEPWQFEAFLPAIEAGIRCGAILTTHEYSAPTMYLWWGQGLPESYGHPPVPAYPDRGPTIGRYRYLYRDILIPRGLIIPLVISEAGIDGGMGAGQRPGYGGQGWLGFRDYWSAELGVSDPVAFYVDQLAWYDSLLRQDPYVIGATIFNVSGGSSWETFEASSLIPRLTEYAQGLQ